MAFIENNLNGSSTDDTLELLRSANLVVNLMKAVDTSVDLIKVLSERLDAAEVKIAALERKSATKVVVMSEDIDNIADRLFKMDKMELRATATDARKLDRHEREIKSLKKVIDARFSRVQEILGMEELTLTKEEKKQIVEDLV